MSADSWEDLNNRYLAASLEWLRVRLQKLIAEVPAPAVQPAPAQPSPQTPPAPEPDR